MYGGKLFGKCNCTLNSGVVKEGVHEPTLDGVLFTCRHHEDARTQQSETKSLQSGKSYDATEGRYHSLPG